MAPNKAQRNTQSRVFTGCGTCRGRHLKCDEARPQCASCQRLNLICQGYQSSLLWLEDGSNGHAPLKQYHRARGTQEYRHPLFSERERKSLAAELLASTEGRPASDLIVRLDNYCVRHNDQLTLDDFQDGPFGVFELRPVASSNVTPGHSTEEHSTVTSSSHAPVTAEPQSSSHRDKTVDLEALISGLQDPPSNVSSIEEIENVRRADVPETAVLQGSSEHDLWQMDDPFSFMGDLDMTLEMPGDDFMRLDALGNTSSAIAADGFAGAFDNIVAAPESPTSPAGSWSHLLAEAPVFLRYYQVESDASKSTKSSFWKSFVLPSAMRTFAELTVFGKATDLASSVFYATIANSAFAMQRSDSLLPEDSHWYAIGTTAENAARHFLQNALRIDAPQQDRQELLSATLSLGLVSLYYHPEKTMNYLIEAERLIRRRGPSNVHNTFQYRALIHVYTYYRIIMESICFATGRCTRGSTNGSLERFSVTEDALGKGLDPTSEKIAEVGYNDIHLDVNGRWQETLYTKIYGVPETLLTMLSQTVKLANGKQRLESLAISSTVSDALHRHTKRLERNLWTLRLKDDPSNDGESSESPLVLSVHQALIVYFYRQVQKVDAMILQDSVCKALDHLEPCLESLDRGHDLTFLVAWAAFVVACEAATEGLQKRVLDCLARIETCASFFIVRRMSYVAQQVWEHRERTDDWTVSWLDVARD